MSKKIKKTVIICGYRCNNKCRFCIDVNKRNLPEKTSKEIVNEMIQARSEGSTYLELIGGEASIRPDIIKLVGFAKKLGFSTITMSTNGRAFAYPNFAKDIVKAGLNNLIFSIHGHTDKLHDFLTQVPGSFKELIAGFKNMKNLLGLDRLGSNTIIIKQNYKQLPQIGKFIYNLGIRNSEFIFVDPTYGAAHDNFFEFVPRISEASPYIHKCLDIGKKEKSHWSVRYVPLCYFKDYLDQVSEIQEVKTFHTQHFAPDFKNLDVENSRKKISRIKPKKCRSCRFYNQCEGIWREYIKHYGDDELKPIIK